MNDDRTRLARTLRERAPRVVTAGVLGAVVALGSGAPAVAAPGEQCAQAGTAISQVPWPQLRQSPQSIWPVADGYGTRVAVVSSGVDAGHPQLSGRVRAGQTYLQGDVASANGDCEGLGTQVAGVIAASLKPGIGFTGLAPNATIVPYRAATAAVLRDGEEAAVASAVRDAAAANPDVIVVSSVTYTDVADLKSAVATAVGRGVIVVASVGDGKNGDGPSVPYPAAYDGVIGVGSAGEDGAVGGDAAAQRVTDLVAPGGDLVSTQVGGGLVEAGGSAMAAGYVAGTVALIRSRWPKLKSADVVRRLLATATPLGNGAGSGLVGPVQAVTETVTDQSPSPMLGAKRVENTGAGTGARAALIAAAALAGLALLGVAFAIALPWGRRRRWRPGIAPRPTEHPEDDEPSPPRLLFEDWASGSR